MEQGWRRWTVITLLRERPSHFHSLSLFLSLSLSLSDLRCFSRLPIYLSLCGVYPSFSLFVVVVCVFKPRLADVGREGRDEGVGRGVGRYRQDLLRHLSSLSLSLS